MSLVIRIQYIKFSKTYQYVRFEKTGLSYTLIAAYPTKLGSSDSHPFRNKRFNYHINYSTSLCLKSAAQKGSDAKYYKLGDTSFCTVCRLLRCFGKSNNGDSPPGYNSNKNGHIKLLQYIACNNVKLQAARTRHTRRRHPQQSTALWYSTPLHSTSNGARRHSLRAPFARQRVQVHKLQFISNTIDRRRMYGTFNFSLPQPQCQQSVCRKSSSSSLSSVQNVIHITSYDATNNMSHPPST